MTTYHALLRDEIGCDFTAVLEAKSRGEAFNQLYRDYPESRVIEVETQAQIDRREARAYDWQQRAYARDEQDLY